MGNLNNLEEKQNKISFFLTHLNIFGQETGKKESSLAISHLIYNPNTILISFSFLTKSKIKMGYKTRKRMQCNEVLAKDSKKRLTSRLFLLSRFNLTRRRNSMNISETWGHS